MEFTKDPKKTFYFFVVVVLAILSLFILKTNLSKKYSLKKQVNQEIVNIQTQSNSDETQAIKKDIEETNLDNIDQELDAIERELDASI